MPYIKSALNGQGFDIIRFSSSLYTQCLGAWYFNYPTHLYMDHTFGRHRAVRRNGDDSVNFTSKFIAQTLLNGNVSAVANATVASNNGICDAIATYQAFSVAMWFISTGEDNDGILVKIGASATAIENYGLYFESGSGGVVNLMTGGATAGLSSTSLLQDGIWHLVVGTCCNALASNKRKIYVDGKLEAQDSTAMGFPTTGNISIIGDGGNTVYDTGTMFVGIWGRELDYQEIVALYNNPMAMLNPKLLPKLNSGTSARIPDLMPWFMD